MNANSKVATATIGAKDTVCTINLPDRYTVSVTQDCECTVKQSPVSFGNFNRFTGHFFIVERKNRFVCDFHSCFVANVVCVGPCLHANFERGRRYLLYNRNSALNYMYQRCRTLRHTDDGFNKSPPPILL